MRINAAKRRLGVKVVYYGPGLSGKTTNLVNLHQRIPVKQRGSLVKLDTEAERTLFFDYFPIALGRIAGYEVKVDFFTVPGQSFYNATRRIVLEAVDGIVFVADSSTDREEANIVSKNNMVQNLTRLGRKIEDIPLIYQWNKRDLPRVLPVRIMEKTLNPENRPSIEAIAIRGVGVPDTQTRILRLVMEKLRGETAGVVHA